MKIGVFGGSFDPIHFGHLLLAETCLRECKLDRIIFVPTGIAPHKPNKVGASGEQRLEMIDLAISGVDEFSANRFEIDSQEINYTVNTLKHFHTAFLDPELFLILGADMFNDLPNWFKTNEICNLAIPIVAHRPGFSLPYYEALSHYISQSRLEMFKHYLVHMPQIELSSSQIRKRVAEGRSIRFQVPRTVETYIHNHKIYVDSSPEQKNL
ncbi:MAG: nicotinate-nucleotide adenylyltransferase [Thermoguttaceae bacterium]